MSTHIVVQGEHLSSIAKKYGFPSYKLIWDHPQNAALKKERQNPNVIFPGDKVFIPDARPKQLERTTGQSHRFVLKTDKLTLRLVLEDLYKEPIDNADCEITVEGQVFKLKTDAKGKVEQEIAPDAHAATLTIKDPRTPNNGVAIPIRIGEMDPVDKESGQKARLTNLGYFAGPIEGQAAQENQALFRSAIEEFQCEHGLSVDGMCGPATQAKLKQMHGC